jgi:acyl transferase domain-containing protein
VDIGWDETLQPNKRFGSFVQDAELFDAPFFGVAVPEAAAMDAQQRLLLQASHTAMQGCLPRQLTGAAWACCTSSLELHLQSLQDWFLHSHLAFQQEIRKRMSAWLWASPTRSTTSTMPNSA